MIQIKDINQIPRFIWNETSCREFAFTAKETKDELVKQSYEMKLILLGKTPAAVVGLYKRTLLSRPFLWALLTAKFSDVSVAQLRLIRKIFYEYLPDADTLIEEGNEQAEKLAVFLGFQKTGQVAIINDVRYLLHRRG